MPGKKEIRSGNGSIPKAPKVPMPQVKPSKQSK